MRLSSTLLATLVLGGLPLLGGTVYQNNTTDTFLTVQYAANGFTGIGDSISLIGTDRYATQATTQFYNQDGFNSGTFSATLSLYTLGVNPAVVDTLLGTWTVNNIAIAANDVANVTFSGLNVTVPNSLIFLLTVSNVSAGLDLGVTQFEPPTAGSSSNQNFISLTGANSFAVSSTLTGFDNLNFSLDATTVGVIPEPTSLALCGLGLGVLGIVVRRRRSC